MTTLFRFLSILPLGLMQGVGWLLGWVVFLLSGVYRRRFLANAHQAGYGGAQWRGAVGPAGQLVAELPRLWLGRPVAIEWDGAQHIEAALALGRGIVFLTPHLGCFEITAQAYAQRFGQRQPMTVLFRPARQPWLRTLVATARRGVWAPFFGQPAYTMTLSARLAQQTGATVLVAWGERLSWGRGFRIHVRPLGVELPAEMTAAAAVINQAMAQLIAECPQQYLWGYARYKQPREEQG